MKHSVESGYNHHNHEHGTNTNSMAVSATLHCITGCAIGEIIGLIVGTIIGLSNGANIALAFGLSFVFGYSLSILPLLKHGLPFKKALPIILAADTLSILTMEIVDNGVMAAVPGAMGAGLINPLYWMTMPVSLVVAFFAAVPVNKFLLNRGQGHALVHEYHH
ncbi:MAG TPA: DUF4396 domain-containing protein [Candidatus Saccharimonadales bacterium]|nr:DUF4396 domain-containing protein [Candidatus Saccharimonadales bacterium]